jgi:hypothetical protein
MIPCRTAIGGRRRRGRTIAHGASDAYRRVIIRVGVAFATLQAVSFHVQGFVGVAIAGAGVQGHRKGIRQHVTVLVIDRARGKGRSTVGGL